MRIMVDTNVLLDILQKREPFFSDSYQALRKAIEAEAECLLSASAVTDIFYVLRKALQSPQQAKERVEQLAALVTFADVTTPRCHGRCRTSRMLWWTRWQSGMRPTAS